MTFDEFRRHAETFGGDLERWPEDIRADARAIAATPEGAVALAAERVIDLALARAPAVPQARAEAAAFAVMQRLAGADGSARVSGRAPSLLSRLAARLAASLAAPGPLRWLVPAASLACSALIGLSLATSLPLDSPRSSAATVLAMVVDDAATPGGWGLP